MKQIRVQPDDRIAALLEAVVPAQSRKRSEFIRQTIAKAVLEFAEYSTRATCAQVLDDKPAFNSAEWPTWSRRRAGKRHGPNETVADPPAIVIELQVELRCSWPCPVLEHLEPRELRFPAAPRSELLPESPSTGAPRASARPERELCGPNVREATSSASVFYCR